MASCITSVDQLTHRQSNLGHKVQRAASYDLAPAIGPFRLTFDESQYETRFTLMFKVEDFGEDLTASERDELVER